MPPSSLLRAYMLAMKSREIRQRGRTGTGQGDEMI